MLDTDLSIIIATRCQSSVVFCFCSSSSWCCTIEWSLFNKGSESTGPALTSTGEDRSSVSFTFSLQSQETGNKISNKTSTKQEEANRDTLTNQYLLYV